MSNRLHDALLDMADPARKLADALDEYRTGGPQFVTSIHGHTFEVESDEPRAVVHEFSRAAGKMDYNEHFRTEAIKAFGFVFDGNEYWIGDYGSDIAMRISPKTLRTMSPFEWNAWVQVMYPNAMAWVNQKKEQGRAEYAARTIIDPAHSHLITGAPTDRAIMEDLQHRADELLHAIDLARTTITGAIPLQTLDIVRGKVKDVLANLAGTIEKDM
jgi:hypothetical protein